MASDRSVTAVDELIAFVRQQLDDDERVARAAIADDSYQGGGFEDADWLTDVHLVKPRFGDAAAELIRTFAVPRRQLAEVKAKRAELLLIEEMARPVPIPADIPRVAQVAESLIQESEAKTAWMLLKIKAQPYAGQPGWREEWRA